VSNRKVRRYLKRAGVFGLAIHFYPHTIYLAQMSYASVRGNPLGLVTTTTIPSVSITNTTSAFFSVPNTVYNVFSGTLPQGTHLFNCNLNLVSTNGACNWSVIVSVDNQIVSTGYMIGIFNPPLSYSPTPNQPTFNISAICPSYKDGANLTINVVCLQTGTIGTNTVATFSGTFSTARII
jgi:hypothetical protein